MKVNCTKYPKAKGTDRISISMTLNEASKALMEMDKIKNKDANFEFVKLKKCHYEGICYFD